MTLLAITYAAVVAAILTPEASNAFAPSRMSSTPIASTNVVSSHSPRPRHLQARKTFLPRLHASKDNDDGEEATTENPYADPNYPNLEFINYDSPDYEVDQGIGDDEFFPPTSREELEQRTLEQIEAMREERRKRNDEYQFETYHASVLRSGKVSLGEWTVYQTDTFMGEEVVSGRHSEARHVPRLLKWDKVLRVVSRGGKVIRDGSAEWRVDGERIVHEERLVTVEDLKEIEGLVEMGDLVWEEEEYGHVSNTFWPTEMGSLDFRGPGGNMCVGKAYTICDALPLYQNEQTEDKATKEEADENDVKIHELRHEGPFSELRTELGIQENGMRFRIKLDYSILDDQMDPNNSSTSTSAPPPLHLRTLTVCRETLDGTWPNPTQNNTSPLFGPPGAKGGLYDPPPVGGEERATANYMMLDFEGGATVLLPHRLDQHHPSDNSDNKNDGTGGFTSISNESFGWVTSLDWTPGPIRYQVDRKVLSGTKLKGLRTLELSEVQSSDAERWRPKDGGKNMRQ